MKRHWLTGVFFCLWIFGSFKPVQADTWTIIAYFAMDNNLEAPMLRNVQEMAKVGSGDVLTILLQADRSQKYTTEAFPGDISYTGTRRFVVKKDELEEVENLGDPDGTQPETIARAIEWGIKYKESQHYAIIFSDHGGGWMGANEDAVGGRSLTPLTDLVYGVKLGLEYAGKSMVDIIAFDECLMAELEVAIAFAPYTKVFVASEEIEPGEGWDWEAWLKWIVDNPTQNNDPSKIGQVICDAYVANVDRQSKAKFYTLSVIDMERLTAGQEFLTKMATFSSALKEALNESSNWNEVAKARSRSDGFGRKAQSDPFGLIDLGMFANQIRNSGLSDTVKNAAEAVYNQLTSSGADGIINYGVVGPSHKNSKGLSIYLPAKEMDGDYEGVFNHFPGLNATGWLDVVKKYTELAAAETTAPVESGVTATKEQDSPSLTLMLTDTGSHIELRGTIGGDDIDSVNIVLAKDDGIDGVVLWGAIPTDQGGSETGLGGEVNYTWDCTWPMLTDGVNTAPSPMFALDSYEADGAKKAIMAVFAEVDPGWDEGYLPAYLLFDVDLATGEGLFMGAFEDEAEDEEDGIAAGIIDLDEDTDTLRPLRVIVTPTGDYEVESGSEVLTVKDLAITRVAVPDGAYQFGLEASDYADNSSTTLVPVTIGGGPEPGDDTGPQGDTGTEPDGGHEIDGGTDTGSESGGGSSGCSLAMSGHSSGWPIGLLFLGLPFVLWGRRRPQVTFFSGSQQISN